jgi:hypothetical protein
LLEEALITTCTSNLKEKVECHLVHVQLLLLATSWLEELHHGGVLGEASFMYSQTLQENIYQTL